MVYEDFVFKEEPGEMRLRFLAAPAGFPTLRAFPLPASPHPPIPYLWPLLLFALLSSEASPFLFPSGGILFVVLVLN